MIKYPSHTGFGLILKVLFLQLGFLFLASTSMAQSRETLQFSVNAYDKVLGNLLPGQTTVKMGDMVVSTNDIAAWRDQFNRQLTGGIVTEGLFDFRFGKQWPNSRVPYKYDASMPEDKKPLFESAMREWQINANINFTAKTSSDSAYLLIKFTGYADSAKMDSFVGMQGGAQILNVAGWGNKINCSHELGHSLGMAHEQCRPDRDTYVTIIASNLNVNPATDVNFAIVPANSAIIKTTYDYDSLMHYGTSSGTFSKTPGAIYLLAKSPNDKWSDGVGPEEIGQTTHLSAGDKQAMASLYGSPLNITGTVTDAAGRPMAGVQVTLSGGSTYRGDNPVSTGADGKFFFNGVPQNSGTYTLTPSQAGTSFTQASRTAAMLNASQTIDFTSVDSAPPDLVINSPAISGVYNNTPDASGTASDTVGVKEVRVALARTSDLVWWNWKLNTWGTTTFNFADNMKVATGTTTWSTTLPNLNVGGYQVHVQSVDISDNASPWKYRHFFVDPERPVAAVTHPLDKSSITNLISIRGTASDGAGTGISNQVVRFTLNQNGDYWTGFNWKSGTTAQDPEVLLSADVVGGQWSYTSLPDGPKARPGTYYVSLFARDNAGNLSLSQPGVNQTQFTVDTTPPTIAILSPATGTTISNLTAINGRATDNKPLNQVLLYLFRFSDSKYWDGTAWGGGGSAILPVSIDNVNGTWTSTGPLPSVTSSSSANRLSNGDYDIIAFAVDGAGNQTRIDSIVTVEFYKTFIYTAGSYSDQDPNNNNENWNNPANWNPYGQPGPDDLAVIPAGNPNLLGGTALVHGLTLLGGQLANGTLTLTNNGRAIWGGGDLNANLIVSDNCNLMVTGSVGRALGSGNYIQIDGTSLWTNSFSLQGSGRSLIRNNGETTVDGNVVIQYYNNGAVPFGRFENLGTLIKNGSGNFTFGGDYGGWTFTNANNIAVNGGKIVLLNQTWLAGTISGVGKIVVTGGALHVDKAPILSGGTVELLTGTLDGGGTFGGDGTFIWSGGTINDTITVGGSANLRITSSDTKTLSSTGHLINNGSAIWDWGMIYTTGRSLLDNNGTFEMRSNVTAYFYNNGLLPHGAFNNTGTVKKTGSDTVTFISDYGGLHFDNSGQLQVLGGKLVLGGGGASTSATINVSSGAQLDMAPGDQFSFAGTSTVTGGGRARLAGGSILGNAATINIAAGTTLECNTGDMQGVFTIGGPGIFEWSGGQINATMTWSSTLNGLLSGGADKNLEIGGRITQSGTVTWTGTGALHGVGGSQFNNLGSFTALNDALLLFYNNGIVPTATFKNTGILRKLTATGTTTFWPDYGGWAFTNSGTVDIQSGTLAFNVDNAAFGDGGVISGAGLVKVIGGNVRLYGATRITGGAMELAGGTLSTDQGSVLGTGKFEWSSGAVSGTAIVGVTNFLISGASDKIMNSPSTVRNTGAAIWTGTGPLRLTGQTYVENYGTFEARNDSVVYYYNNGVIPFGGFRNFGMFTKKASAGTTTFWIDYGGPFFDNSGTLSVETGIVTLGGGGTWDGGTVSVAPTAELRLLNNLFTLNHGVSFLAGTTKVTGGEVRLLSTTLPIAANAAISLESGLISGSGGFSGPGTLAWTGGTIGANLDISAQSRWALTGAGQKRFVSGVIRNYGVATWQGTGEFYGEAPARLDNYGSFTMMNDSAFTFYNNGQIPTTRLNNYGILAKSGSAGVTTFGPDYGGWVFQNTGTIQMDSGVLSLRNACFFTNSTIAGTGRVRVDSGNVAAGGTLTLNGSATFENASGVVQGSTTVSGPGTFEWSGGEIQGTHTMTPTGRMLISGAATKSIATATTLNNDGLITWTGTGNIQGVGQSKINNTGVFAIKNDAVLNYYNNGVSPGAAFVNSGSIVKSLSTGTTTFSPDYGGWYFQNAGLIDVQSGILNVGPIYVPSSTTQLKLALGSETLGSGYSRVAYGANADLKGGLTVALVNGYIPPTNTSYLLMTYPSRTGQFATPALPVLPNDRSWKLDYQPTGLLLTVLASVSNESYTYDKAQKKFQLTMKGPLGQYALFLGSTNLVDWVSLSTNTPFNGSIIFTDPLATNSVRFYKTILVQ